LLLLSFFTVQAQYFAAYYQDAGNPGSLNTLGDASTTGWNEILPLDNSTATQYGDSTLDLSGNGSSNDDNDYIELFVPPAVDMAVSEFLNFPTTALVNSTVDFDVVVQNLGLNTISGATLDIWFNGSLSSSLPVATLAAGETDTIAASVTASASGRDSVVAALQAVPGDVNPANDTLAAAYDVLSALPLPFVEMWDTTLFNPQSWPEIVGGAEIIDSNGVSTGTFPYPVPSEPYFLSMNNANSSLTSGFFDLSAVSDYVVALWESEHDLELGESVFLEYFDNGGAWELLHEFAGTNNGFGVFEPFEQMIFLLPPAAYHNSFRIRFRTSGTLASTDEWYFDNIRITAADSLPSDVATNLVSLPQLTKIPQTQTGITSAIVSEGKFTNLGPANTGDVNVAISDSTLTGVFSDAITGVTIDPFSDTTFDFSPWDASGAAPGQYDVAVFTSNFTDTDPSNDTAYAALELGEKMAYDDGNHTNNVAIVSTNRSRLGTRFTLTDADSLTSVSMLITSSTTAADSFSIDIYEAAGDTPTVAFARLFRGIYGDLGPLPALVTFLVDPKLPLPAGDFYAIIDSDSTGNSNEPLGVSSTALGASNIPRRFGGSSPGLNNNNWLFFEEAPNTAFHGFTPILRVGFQETEEIHDYLVKSVSAQACMVAGETYDVKGVVENRGNQPETDVPIELREDGVMIADVLLSLNPGETDTVTFAYTPATPGNFKLEIVSLLAGEQNPGNDMDSAFVSVLASGQDIIFFDDFSDTTFTFANWIVTNDGGDGVWMVYEEPYPNNYTLPPTSSGNVFSADADEGGSGDSTLTTAILALDLSAYDEVGLDVDSDWRHLDTEDTARIKVSSDDGATWITVLEYPGVSVRNEHISLDLSAQLANSVNALIAFQSIQPGFDWWWTIDNVCVTGVLPPPPPYLESFEGAFPPTNWSKLNPDGGPGWNQQANGTSPVPGWSGGTITAPPGGEDSVAFCTRNTGGPASNDQWLVTPKMVNIQPDDYISFWRSANFNHRSHRSGQL
jgi:hypothetical protein